MKNSSLRSRFAGIVGNALEHYDNALFGLLAPVLAPLFFENTDPLTALIWTYGMLPLGFITRPLGALLFGWIGDCFGRRHALLLSLFGMAIVTTGMGFLPTYAQMGAKAPFLLGLGRMLQGFFAAGESAGGAIFVLEHSPSSQRGFVSSCYDASSVGGILFASALIFFASMQGGLEQNWRLLFWGGAATAIFGLLARYTIQDGLEFKNALRKQADQSRLSGFAFFSQAKVGLQLRPWLSIILASGFSHTTFYLAFTFMNGYVPLVTDVSRAEVMQINTFLLIVDFLLLPCFGFLASRFGKEIIMSIGALGLSLAAIPLFALLDQASLGAVIGVRVGIVMLGTAFAAPYYAWAIEQTDPCHRYRILAVGGAIGGLLIGAPSSAICLWFYQLFGSSWASGLYLLILGAAAGSMVLFGFFEKLGKTSAEIEQLR